MSRAARGENDGPDGIVLVDKPAGWTSHDVVARMRRVLGTRKVGHGGTLDPMATGLLVIAAGRATRLLTYYSAHDKDYLATVRLGQSTVTDDAEGDVTASADAGAVSEADVAAAVAGLTGAILQRPSAVSAIKVDGQRAYARVRAGEDVELAARPVTVSRFDVLGVRREGAALDGTTALDVDIAVTVSSGTYVRALARDLGETLGVGGHLTSLRRTRIGGASVEDAQNLDDLTALAESSGTVPLLPLTPAALAALPAAPVTAKEAAALGYGKAIELGDRVASLPKDPHDYLADVLAIAPDGEAVAVLRRHQNALKPVIVFRPAQAE